MIYFVTLVLTVFSLRLIFPFFVLLPFLLSFRAQASKLGLLSKLEKAGLTLKDVEKLLPLGERMATPSVIEQACADVLVDGEEAVSARGRGGNTAHSSCAMR